MSPLRGGPSQAILEVLGPLREAGVKAEIACTNDNGSGVLDVPLIDLLDWNGAPVRFFPRLSLSIRPLSDFAFSMPFTRWVWQNVQDYDLLHVHALFSYCSSAAMFIARQRRVPYICRPSGLLCRWSLTQSAVRKRLFYALIDRQNLDQAAALEFTSEKEQTESTELGLKLPSFVLPYGLNTPELLPGASASLRSRLKISDGDLVILFLSRLHPKKGAHLLLQAMLNRPPGENVHVVIAGAGDGRYRSKLKAMIAGTWLQPRVHFQGFVEGDWKQILIQGADLFVLPSQSESFGIAVMEAAAVGTPIVTTREVPLAPLLERFNLGWTCEPTAKSVAAVMEQALTGLGRIREDTSRQSAARKLIKQNFDWTIIAARLKEVYSAVLCKSALPSWPIAAIEG